MTDTTTEGAGMAKPKSKPSPKPKHAAAGKLVTVRTAREHGEQLLRVGTLARCVAQAVRALDEATAKAVKADAAGGVGQIITVFKRLIAVIATTRTALVRAKGADPDMTAQLSKLADDLRAAITRRKETP
jgi:hypothetical protein